MSRISHQPQNILEKKTQNHIKVQIKLQCIKKKLFDKNTLINSFVCGNEIRRYKIQYYVQLTH